MEAIAVAIMAGALTGLGYVVRRLIERSAETEGLQRQSLALDVEHKRRARERNAATIQVVVLVLPRE